MSGESCPAYRNDAEGYRLGETRGSNGDPEGAQIVRLDRKPYLAGTALRYPHPAPVATDHDMERESSAI